MINSIKIIQSLLAASILVFFTSTVSLAFSSHYELLPDSTIEIDGVESKLTGTFSLAPGFVIIDPDGKEIPIPGADFTLGKISLSGGGKNIVQDYSTFQKPSSITYSDISLYIFSHEISTGGEIENMYEIAIDRTYLSEPEPTQLYFKQSYLVPQFIGDLSFNYLAGFDPSKDIIPDEVLFTYGLVEKTYTAVKNDPTESLFEWTALLESTQEIGTLSIHGVNIDPVPIPGALLLFGSGLLGLAGIRRK